MSNKRMFSLKIVDTDEFLDMPPSTQNLYFHLNMRADDDGFVSSPKKIMKIINASIDDMKILISKDFVIPFDSGICVIKHWKIHNLIRSDRYTETEYKKEKKLLIEEDKKYKLNNGMRNVIPNGAVDKIRLDKVRLDKNSINNVKNQRSKKIDTPIEKSTKRNMSEIPTVWNFSLKLKEMKKDKRRHINIIALYWSFKAIQPENKEQYNALLKRELRPARELVGFSDEKILEVMDWLENENTIKWTMETILKFSTENLGDIDPIGKKKYGNY